MAIRSIMQAEDGEKSRKVTITTRQRNGLFVMIGIQALCILFVYATFFLSAIAGIDAAGASIFSIFLYVMIYLKYCQACQSLADFGIRLTWMKVCKILSPVLYIPALVLAILWLSAS